VGSREQILQGYMKKPRKPRMKRILKSQEDETKINITEQKLDTIP
jgi:hypothetical protein